MFKVGLWPTTARVKSDHCTGQLSIRRHAIVVLSNGWQIMEGPIHAHQILVLVNDRGGETIAIPLPQRAKAGNYLTLGDGRLAAHEPPCSVLCKQPIQVAEE